MTTRRHFFEVGAGLAVGSMLGSGAARAFAPQTDIQAPGFYRYKIGAFELTAVTDGLNSMALPNNFVTNVTREDVNKALEEALMPKDRLSMAFTPLVINTGSKLVVVDAGNGPAAAAQSNGAIGLFHANLEKAGFSRDSVDAVIISHFHPDHINGLVGSDGKPAFTHAEILVPEPEWRFWMDDGQMSRAPEGLKAVFANVRRVFGALPKTPSLYQPGKPIIGGIEPIATFGHTPGHCSFRISSGADDILVTSDLTNLPALFLRHPGWHVMYDMDPGAAEATRRKMFDMAASDKTTLQGYHYPFPATGHVARENDGYRYIPSIWTSKL